MKQIEFITIEADPAAVRRLEEMLGGFAQKYACEVRQRVVAWEDVWRELAQTGIYRRGADVSEVGTSWLDSLSAMNVLRPITSREVNALGVESAFLPATWHSIARSGAVHTEAIPFRADVRVIFYWKDMVEAAGLDPAQIFRTPQGMLADLQALQRLCPTPWGCTTRPNTRNTLYYLASWVWALGGDFLAPDGKEVAFTCPQALEGIRFYYELGHFLPETRAPLSGEEITRLFLDRKVAAMLGGPWFFNTLRGRNWPPERSAQIGITPPPGPAFVGGTCLVIWQHCRQQPSALNLVNFLTSTAVQADYCPRTSFLPVRRDTWSLPPFSTDPHYQAMYQALLHGRALSPISLWGLVEERLAPVLGQVWAELRSNPATDLPALLRNCLEPLAQRLNIMLAG